LLRVGDAIIRLDSLRARYPMATVDPEILERDARLPAVRPKSGFQGLLSPVLNDLARD
jgi:hypothetical protein